MTMLRAIMGGDPELIYVAYEFPVLTQTFTTAEVLGLAAAGFDLRVVACRPAREAGDADVPRAEVLPGAPVSAWLA